MNCEKYREALGADPSFDGGAGHLSECASCQAYRKEILELDKKISGALAIDVPALAIPELPEIDSDNVVSLPKRRRVSAPLFAVAATVVLAAFIGISAGWDTDAGSEHDTLADELLAHLDHEPYALRVTDVPVSDARLGRVVPANIARLDHSAGLITYAQTCPINGRDVPHLVIQGERGPVTLLLMPEEKVEAVQSVTGDNVNGIILPVGDGSIAIFGTADEDLGRIEQNILDSVTWST